MSSVPPQAEPEHPAPPVDHTQFYLETLHNLIAVGTELINRLLHPDAQAAESEPPATPSPETMISFERASRAVRRSILLARKLQEPAPPPVSDARDRNRKASHARIAREVEDTIQRTAETDWQEAALHAEFRERVEAPEFNEEIDDRPVEDIITDIIRDLGLAHVPGTHPWKRRTPADITTLHERAAALSAAINNPLSAAKNNPLSAARNNPLSAARNNPLTAARNNPPRPRPPAIQQTGAGPP